MVCKNCGKEMEDGAAFCGGCGAKAETMTVPEQPAPSASAAPAADTAAKEKEDRQNTIIGMVFIAVVIGVVIFLFSSIFGGGLEVDYGDFKNTDEASLSGFSADYNENIGYLTVEGTIKAKVDCHVGVIVYFDVYNEYDRVITTCRIETDALGEGEKYTFDDMYNIDSGSDVVKIVIRDVMVF